MSECNPHPDAPHGFDRNGSHSEDRYVCDCEGWEPPGDLRTRIAAAMRAEVETNGLDSPVEDWIPFLADAVIAELDLAIPCAANGCRMRQIARRHAEASGYLTDSGRTIRSAEKLGLTGDGE